MSIPNETQVFISVKEFLVSQGWHVLGGQPPSGTDQLPIIEIKDPGFRGKGSKGSYKPDLVAWHNSCLAIIELKPKFSKSDRDKVSEVLNSPERLSSLWQGLIERNITLQDSRKISDVKNSSRIVGGLGYGGTRMEHSELWRFFVDNGEVEVTPGSFVTYLNE